MAKDIGSSFFPKFIAVCCFVLFLNVFLFSSSNTARMGAQIGVGTVGAAAGFMIGTANACCLGCVSSVGNPHLKDLKFISGTMTTGGLFGTVVGGTAGVYFMGNAMIDDDKKIQNPWQTFGGTMAGGFASCAAGYILDFTMHKIRGEDSIRPGSFYLVGLMLSPIAETFAYHQIVNETQENPPVFFQIAVSF